MAIYRKRPLTVEAVQITKEASREDPEAGWHTWLLQWAESLGADTSEWIVSADRIEIPTLEGNMKVLLGDYVVCGTDGEFYPCKPEIFEEVYEKISN